MATEKRLIDANDYPCSKCGKSYCYENCKGFKEWLNNTVDAVEVVHGHWFLTETEYLNCSVCGKAYYTGIETWSAAMDNLKYAGGYKYCPNCGAKMDGDGNET